MGESGMIAAELFQSGIQTENSDIRVHVGVLARACYVFPTKEGLRVIEQFRPPLKTASQEGVVGVTAQGYPCKLEWFLGLKIIRLRSWPESIWAGWTPQLSTSEKGDRAVSLVCELLSRGAIPIAVHAHDDERKSVQISGTDIVIYARKRIQVKCDYRCGNGHPNCTGNLFLQIAERNPLKRY